MGEGCCGHGHGHGNGHEQERQSQAPAKGPGAPVAVQTAVKTSLTVTPTAAVKIREIMKQEQKDPATHGLRLGVQGGGCSGMSYFMDFDTKQEDDRVVEQDGVRVFIDPKSILHLSGSVLDYTDGLMGAGFAIKNPNVKNACGCGHSFST